ncbi:acylphosphatase [Niveibacterium terrae]|uniref:acylphosphatase n=1 Tax=Niveibacterium terrae TaxID=3373598 RepID=UPI003A91A3E2
MTIQVQLWRIRGRVQGVGFRWYMVQQASLLGLAGFVRNRRDGSVEALVAGEAEALGELLRWARRGPPTAQVTDIEILSADGEAVPADFSERPTL